MTEADRIARQRAGEARAADERRQQERKEDYLRRTSAQKASIRAIIPPLLHRLKEENYPDLLTIAVATYRRGLFGGKTHQTERGAWLVSQSVVDWKGEAKVTIPVYLVSDGTLAIKRIMGGVEAATLDDLFLSQFLSDALEGLETLADKYGVRR